MKAVVFDLDGTLCLSSAAVEPAMVEAMREVMNLLPLGVVTAAGWPRVLEQLVVPFGPDTDLAQLQVMPSMGAEHYSWTVAGWRRVYRDEMELADRTRARIVFEQCARSLDLWEETSDVVGERVQDRGTHITFSALGASASLERKHAWDPDGSKRGRLRSAVAEALPDMVVGVGGATSVDVTPRGLDKGLAVRRLAKIWDLELTDICFVGDQLGPGGNDHPVTELPVCLHSVTDPSETLALLDIILSNHGFADRTH